MRQSIVYSVFAVILAGCCDTSLSLTPDDLARSPQIVRVEGPFDRVMRVNPDVLFVCPLDLHSAKQIQRIGVDAAAPGLAKLVLYHHDAATQSPRELLVASPVIAIDTQTKEWTLPEPVALNAGPYWIGGVFQSSIELVASLTGQSIFYQFLSFDDPIPAPMIPTRVEGDPLFSFYLVAD